VKKSVVALIALATFVAGIIVCAVVLLVAFPQLKQSLIEGELLGYITERAMPLPYHTLNQSSLRPLLGEGIPGLYPELTDALLERIMAVIQKTYAVHIEAAQNPPSSDEQMVDYLDRMGLLAQMKLEREAALSEMQGMDPAAHYLPPVAEYTEYYSLTPPPAAVRLPAEFEEMGAVALGWPIYYPYSWQRHADLTRYVASEAWAYVFVPNEYWQKAVELFLTHKQVSLDQVRFLYAPLDDVWLRDNGPTTVEAGPDRKPLMIVNPYLPNGVPYAKGDSELPLELARYLGVPAYRLPLIVEGGNIVGDGQGTFIMFESVLYHNPEVTRESLERIMREYFGCQRLILFPMLKAEMSGHIDMVVKFLDASTVLVAQSDPKYQWYEDFEAIAAQLAQTPSATGENYTVHRVMLAENDNNSLNYWTYVNSLILNHKVIVPTFGVEQDEKALELYRQIMPGYEVVGVNFSDFPLGSVHCNTKEIPATLVSGIGK